MSQESFGQSWEACLAEEVIDVAESCSSKDAGTFLERDHSTPTIPTPLSSPLSPSSTREPVRILVIGTAHGIDTIVHTLYAKSFAHISEWSCLLPHTSGKLMRILTRYVQVD